MSKNFFVASSRHIYNEKCIFLYSLSSLPTLYYIMLYMIIIFVIFRVIIIYNMRVFCADNVHIREGKKR